MSEIVRPEPDSDTGVTRVLSGEAMTLGTAGQLDPELEARIAKGYPLRKLGLPDDMAEMAVFLASEGRATSPARPSA